MCMVVKSTSGLHGYQLQVNCSIHVYRRQCRQTHLIYHVDEVSNPFLGLIMEVIETSNNVTIGSVCSSKTWLLRIGNNPDLWEKIQALIINSIWTLHQGPGYLKLHSAHESREEHDRFGAIVHTGAGTGQFRSEHSTPENVLLSSVQVGYWVTGGIGGWSKNKGTSTFVTTSFEGEMS
jgi:hypothetical protein